MMKKEMKALCIFIIVLSLLIGRYSGYFFFVNNFNVFYFILSSSISFFILFNLAKNIYSNKTNKVEQKPSNCQEKKEDICDDKIDIRDELVSLEIKYIQNVNRTGKRNYEIENKIKEINLLLNEENEIKNLELKRIKK